MGKSLFDTRRTVDVVCVTSQEYTVTQSFFNINLSRSNLSINLILRSQLIQTFHSFVGEFDLSSDFGTLVTKLCVFPKFSKILIEDFIFFSLPFLIHSVCWKQVFSLSKIFQSLTGVCLVFDRNRSKLTEPNIPSGNWAEIRKAIKLR